MVSAETPIRIGIPRSILHYEFGGAIASFVERLGPTVVLSPETNDDIFRRGKRLVIDELCFPIKAFVGHVAALAETDVDRIFVPVVTSHESGRVFPCHPRTRLADIVRALRVCDAGRLLTPAVTFDANGLTRDVFLSVGRALGASDEEIGRALPAPTRAARATEAAIVGDDRPVIGIIGHPYLVADPWMNGSLVDRLEDLGCASLTGTDIGIPLSPDGTGLHFELAAHTLVAGRRLDGMQAVDGIVFLLAFNCGPDGDIAGHLARTIRKPLLTLVLDELQSPAGMLTRIEAFVDLIDRTSASRVAATGGCT